MLPLPSGSRLFQTHLWLNRGLWLRVLVCWGLVCTFPFFDEVKKYDLRFALRGAQDHTKQIVLINFDQDDWTAWVGARSTTLQRTKEIPPLTDASFWRGQVWNDLLDHVLAQGPKVIGVTLYFNPDLPKPNEQLRALFDPRVQWAAQLDGETHLAPPLMTNSLTPNLGLITYHEDEDHILRRINLTSGPANHLALKLAEFAEPIDLAAAGEDRLINFRGPGSLYPSVSALNVLRGNVDPEFFRDKIVIIGSRSLPGYQTPLGRMSRADVLAQIVDNVLGDLWIWRLKPSVGAVYLLLVLLLSVGIITSYPSTVAAVFLVWLALGTTSLSIWVFDTFNVWVTAFSSLATLLVSYIIFIGYQLSLKENQTWQLEREKQLLSELDQLRNNFVSLISHDLKTPIAKIQAICDRLLAGSVSDDVRDGLGSLRQESVELHRYIQSILQVSRLESNRSQLRKEPTDLNAVVEKVIRQVRPLASDKRQHLDLKLEPMFLIEVDGVLVQEVILNLIENAVKYTPSGGQIEVQTREVEDKVVFTVKDSGPGIPLEDREHLFEKFYRGQAHQTEIKGTGLGLFLAKYFIELHGGEVFLESELGTGTRVGFQLPLDSVE